MTKHRILLELCLDDNRAVLLQRHFHETLKIPLNRIHIHPDNISDLSEKASTKLHYGDIILGILASPFGEFIDAFVVKQVEEISAEWRLASLCSNGGPTILDVPERCLQILPMRQLLSYVHDFLICSGLSQRTLVGTFLISAKMFLLPCVLWAISGTISNMFLIPNNIRNTLSCS